MWLLNSEDNQFAFYNGPSGQAEWLYNNGARSSVRLKGYDDPSGFLWDLSAYSGVVVEEAELHLCLTGGSVINALVVSTINAEWTEGGGWGSTASAGEPCWRWRSYPDGEWTFVGSDFSTASFGNFGTLTSFGYKHNDTFRQYSFGGYDWIAMKLDPSIVYAMVLDNYGIVVTDPRFGSENGNPKVYSSEQNSLLYSPGFTSRRRPRRTKLLRARFPTLWRRPASGTAKWSCHSALRAIPTTTRLSATRCGMRPKAISEPPPMWKDGEFPDRGRRGRRTAS